MKHRIFSESFGWLDDFATKKFIGGCWNLIEDSWLCDGISGISLAGFAGFMYPWTIARTSWANHRFQRLLTVIFKKTVRRETLIANAEYNYLAESCSLVIRFTLQNLSLHDFFHQQHSLFSNSWKHIMIIAKHKISTQLQPPGRAWCTVEKHATKTHAEYWSIKT